MPKSYCWPCGLSAAGISVWAGAAGWVIAGASLIMDDDLCLLELYVRKSDVSMKTTADPVVTLASMEAGPELPKSVWLEVDPKVEPMEAPLPI